MNSGFNLTSIRIRHGFSLRYCLIGYMGTTALPELAPGDGKVIS